MLSFDTTLINVYLTSVFSIAAIAVVLAIAVATTEVVRRRPGQHGAAAPLCGVGARSRPSVDVLERPQGPAGEGEELVGDAVPHSQVGSR